MGSWAVQPKLYFKYEEYVFDKIHNYEGEVSVIPKEFISFVNEIYDAYGHLTGDELEALNHTESPWLNARNGLKSW